jgi:hypothetical protein
MNANAITLPELYIRHLADVLHFGTEAGARAAHQDVEQINDRFEAVEWVVRTIVTHDVVPLQSWAGHLDGTH